MQILKKSLVSIMALSFFFIITFSVKASAYPFFGVQTSYDDYLYFGNDDYPSNSKQGLTFSVDESSISFQSIVASVTTEYVPNSTLVDARQITDFAILANGRIVDEFEAAWDSNLNQWRTYYRLRIALDDWNVGSNVTLQVVAIHTDNNLNQYAVAWSEPQGPFQLKPLPVIDKDAISVLELILARLNNLSVMLEMKLTQLTKAVEKIYTPSEATEQRFDNAVNSIKDKLPMDELIDQVDNANQVLEETRRKLQQPGTTIKIGGEFCFIPGVAESCFPVMDLTEWREQLLLFRTIIEAALWVYFFYMIFEKLTPKPRL